MIQGSDEWHQARCGCITASRVADMLATIKSGWGAGRANYAAELLCERLTRQPTPHFVNEAMRFGSEQEPFARQAYSDREGVDVFEGGFILHPEIERAGASPDGYVGDDGLVEIKVPLTANHLETLLTEKIPQRYMMQMQFQLAVTGRQWCDFISYDPRVPEHLRLFVKRIPRDPSLILTLEHETAAFDAEIEAQITALSKRYARAA